jgi:hypothetical protein
MSQKNTAYQQALEKIRETEAEAQAIVDAIDRAATRLRGMGWKTLVIGGIPSSDPSQAPPKEPDLHIDSWPDGKSVGNAINAHHQAISAAKTIYDAIPSNERMGFQPPPGV